MHFGEKPSSIQFQLQRIDYSSQCILPSLGECCGFRMFF